MRILCLDLSTHLGYAVFDGVKGERPKLIAHRTIHLGKSVVKFGAYPWCYQWAAEAHVVSVAKLLDDYRPEVVVVEEINLGKNRYTQKLLDFLHYELLTVLGGDPLVKEVCYLDSSEWRRCLGLQMSKEQKKANARLSKAKRAAREGGAKLDKKALGIRGKVTAKHLALEKANGEYGLQLKVKDNDAADAICLGLAYCNNATPCDGV